MQISLMSGFLRFLANSIIYLLTSKEHQSQVVLSKMTQEPTDRSTWHKA